MKKRLSFLAMSLLASCGICLTAHAEEYYEVNTAPDSRMQDYRKGEVIVKFKTESAVQVRRSAAGRFQSSGVSAVDNLLQEIGAKEIEPLMPLTGALTANTPRKVRSHNGTDVEIKDMSKLYCLKIESGDVEDVVKQLKALPEVEFAEPNYLVYINSTPNDPLYSEQWGLPAVNVDKLWDKPLLSTKRPTIAILDTGVDITHPDLADNIWTNEAEANGSTGYDDDGNGYKDDIHGWDFVNQRGTIDDYNGHGTHCAGIAGAVGNNGIGICGANPDAWIMPVTVMQSDGTGDIATIIKGIDYAAANGADVISMSFGHFGNSLAEEQALGRAYATSILVAAAGNNGFDIYNQYGPTFPAGYTFVLGVQANTPVGRALFSNYDSDGPIYSQFGEEQLYNYELSAPGTNITSTYPGGRYKALNGTSMACPLVAGAVSRLLSVKEYGSKELLFGDLIHTAGTHVDFEAACDLDDAARTPAVSLVSWRIEDETDSDGRFDAGEIINFYPTLRNEWGEARNIQSWIQLSDLEGNVMKIMQTTADFDKPLSSYAKAESATPFRFKMANDVADGRHCRIMFYAQCDGMAEPYQQEIVFTAENGVEIGGMIDHDLTLEPGVSYIVTQNLAVPDGVTLTILPGAVLKFSDGSGIKKSENATIIAKGTPENPIIFTARDLLTKASVDFSIDLSYVKCSKLGFGNNKLKDTGFSNCVIEDCSFWFTNVNGMKFVSSNIALNGLNGFYVFFFQSNNLIGNACDQSYGFNFQNSAGLLGCNIFGNSCNLSTQSNGYNEVGITHFAAPSYIGSSIESKAREGVIDMESGFGYRKFDLSNMLTQPHPDAHGCLWKVMVNGMDAQDEFEMLPPLGVGRHKFEVWYSKKIDESEAPFIAMGVRPPYTQTAIAQDGFWRTETTRFVPFGNGELESYDILNFKDNCYLETISGSCVRSGDYSYIYSQYDTGASYRVSQTRNNIQNGKYRFKFKVKPDALTEEGSQYIFANDDKTLVTSTDATTYEVITEVRHNKVEWGYTQEMPINAHVYFYDAELELLEEYPNGWDQDVSVYTAYLDIKGSMAIDGLNRIYVSGCKDLEYFDIPLENTRFNVEVAAAGSMSAGFMATPGIGKVDLEWEDQDENVDDILGYNLYRMAERETTEYRYDEEGGWGYYPVMVTDTIRVNQRLLDGTTYTDFDVVPGKRYDYYYKILRTSMEENSPSTVVSVVPLTASKGDANGSLSVDVADVVTEVSYITGGDPQPFIFDAADVNEDATINVLDVVGTVRIIINPEAGTSAIDEGMVKYWIEDGKLWIDTDVALGGVQFTFDSDATVTPLEALAGFEIVNNAGNDRLTFMAYSMTGRTIAVGQHALLAVGQASPEQVVCSDPAGHNVVAMQADMSGMADINAGQMRVPSPNPFIDAVTIPYVIATNGSHEVQMTFSDLSGRMVDSYTVVAGYGEHSYTWCPAVASGVYLVTLSIDGNLVQTSKLIKK